MSWRLGWMLSIIFCASLARAGHEVDIDARRATPGLRLELNELPTTLAQTTKSYRLHAIGYPRGVVFGVFTKNFAHLFEEVASGFQVDGSGNLVSSGIFQSQRLDELVIQPGPYPRGAVWQVALVSADRTLLAFAKTIPYPITARDGPCTVQLELLSYRGDHFVASGAGFAPGDEVVAELHYSGRLIEKRQRASSEGLLPLNVLSHRAIDADRKARYTVKGRACEVAVDYEWGEPALFRR
jgi:hypothetical protein